MSTPIHCPVCGGVFGSEVTYPITALGQDPPETIYTNEDLVAHDDNDVAYCSQSCLDIAMGKNQDLF